MAITEENGNGFYMPVAPAYGNNGFGGGFGGDWGWIILLLLCAGGGWGGFGGFGGGMMNYDFPWLLTGQQNVNTNTNNGFRDAMINDNITSVRDGISSLSTQLCGCCGDMQMALANLGANIEQGANARAIANMQQLYGIGTQIADYSADSRLASCQTQNTISTEAAATRAANASNTQAVLDKLCQLELDGVKAQVEAKNDRIAELQNQLAYANLTASQTAQTAQILAGQAAEIDGVYNRLKNCPVGTYNVCNPLTPVTSGCGCGAF